MQKKKILVFSGAGVSKESGIDTFRDNGGLWNKYDVMKVAHINAWRKDPQTVIDFYNLRRSEMDSIKPNKAHLLIAELENWFDVTVATQNVDNLHELAGSTKVIHLHGEITKLRSEHNPTLVYDWVDELKLGDKSEDGSQLRPDICWFGEELNSLRVDEVKKEALTSNVCIIIGTSMQVAPANLIPFLTPETTLLYYIDPGDVEFYVPEFRKLFFYHIKDVASSGMEKMKEELFNVYKMNNDK